MLFVSRSKSDNNPSPVIHAQAQSLSGILDLTEYVIKGKGWLAYLKAIRKLRNHIKSIQYDLVHAHYSYIGMIAAIATAKPVIVSLMGSDVEDYRIGRILIRIFNRICWEAVIVKSHRLKDKIKLKNAIVIPNGINLDQFRQLDSSESMQKLGLDVNQKYILFLADPSRPEKNFELAGNACNYLSNNFDLLVVHDKSHNDIPLYLSMAEVLLVTSHFEGSPNVIKEAMACNCPIVSTDVGDVKEIIGDTEGCYITSFDPEDVEAKLRLALDFGKRTKGREKIRHLDEKIIAEKLIEAYRSVLKDTGY